MLAPIARHVAHSASKRLPRSLTARVLVPIFMAIALLPAVSAAQSVASEPQSVTLAPVPSAVLTPIEIAPPPYANAPTYEPAREPRTRTIVEPYRGGEVPFGSELTTRSNRTLIAIGGASLGVSWIGSVVGWFASIHCGGFFTCSSASGWLWVPVVGPWLALSDPSSADPGVATVIVVDGIVQTASLGLMIAGISMRHQVVVTRVVADNRGTHRERTTTSWSIAPSSGNGQHGLVAMGTF